MEWLLNLWNKNKILFWVLLPLVIIAFVVQFIVRNQSSSTVDELRRANKDDRELKNKQNEINEKADKLKIESDRIEKEINNIDKDINWHKDQ